MGYRALVIDNDLGLLVFLKQWLEREGFAVLTARSGREGIQKTSQTHPDVIILDVMISETLGRTTYRQIRSICQTPIVILTALVGRDSPDQSPALGADDPMTKSCSFEELGTCIQEMLSPPMRRDRHVLFDDGHLCVDVVEGARIRNRRVQGLSPTESRLLLYLARRKGNPVTYRELLTNVWGPAFAAEVHYLCTYIDHLRHKLEKDPAHPHYIRTHQEIGFSFADDSMAAID